MRAAASIAFALALLSACRAGGVPSPSPPGFQEVFTALARHGVTVTEIVAGDPGCDDPTLVGNAVRFTATMSDGNRREVHLFGFRDAAALRNGGASLERCRSAFASQLPGGASVGSMTSSPYYAFGTPWSAELETLLREAVTTTSAS